MFWLLWYGGKKKNSLLKLCKGFNKKRNNKFNKKKEKVFSIVFNEKINCMLKPQC